MCVAYVREPLEVVTEDGETFILRYQSGGTTCEVALSRHAAMALQRVLTQSLAGQKADNVETLPQSRKG